MKRVFLDTNIIANPATGFEDMLQYQCAKAYGCDVVITNNTRHWSFSKIPVFTSLEYLEKFG